MAYTNEYLKPVPSLDERLTLALRQQSRAMELHFILQSKDSREALDTALMIRRDIELQLYYRDAFEVSQ